MARPDFDPKDPGEKWTWAHTVDTFRSNAMAIAIVLLALVLAAIIAYDHFRGGAGS